MRIGEEIKIIEFSFTEEQNLLKEMVRDFVISEIKPIAKKIDEEEKIPEDSIKKIAYLGVLGAAFPVKYGGRGFGEVGYCIIQKEISRGCSSTATFIEAHQSLGSSAIYLGEGEELKQKYLFPLAQGKMIAAFCLTEAQAGSDSFNIKTKAKRDVDYYKW